MYIYETSISLITWYMNKFPIKKITNHTLGVIYI